MRHAFALLAAALGLSPAMALAAETGVTGRGLQDTSPIRALGPGPHELRVERPGFIAINVPVDLPEGQDTPIVVRLTAAPSEEEALVVTAARSGTVVGDQPTRVEAVPEECEHGRAVHVAPVPSPLCERRTDEGVAVAHEHRPGFHLHLFFSDIEPGMLPG